MDQQTKILNVYKPISMTPAQLVGEVKKQLSGYSDTKIGFAGRLDPMAHGVMILMVGEECKNRDQYQDLPKSYRFFLLPGFESDTYDPMGEIELRDANPEIEENQIHQILKTFEGGWEQVYPPYSSYHVDGKPLHQWSREGRLSEIEMPTKRVNVTNIKLIKKHIFRSSELIDRLCMQIAAVDGSFNQSEVTARWKNIADTIDGADLMMYEIIVECSSGTYIRDIANSIGKSLGCGAIAVEILRESVGEFRSEESIVLPGHQRASVKNLL